MKKKLHSIFFLPHYSCFLNSSNPSKENLFFVFIERKTNHTLLKKESDLKKNVTYVYMVFFILVGEWWDFSTGKKHFYFSYWDLLISWQAERQLHSTERIGKLVLITNWIKNSTRMMEHSFLWPICVCDWRHFLQERSIV